MTTNSGDLAPDVTTFNPKHVYADTGSYRVDLTLTDSATPAHLVTDTKTVVVTNVDPVLGSLQLTPSSVVDHQEVTLSASFTDPGTLDTFTLTVDWGAGAMPPQPLGTDRTFSVKHAYDAAGPVTITATVEDRDGGKSSQSVNLVVLPSNHAPTGLLFDATPTGANVVVTGSFVDPDTTDTHTLALTWGDGLSTTQELAAGETTFNAPHVYATSNTYTVTATVTDHPADASTSPVSKQVVVTVPAETASDLIDQMSSAVRSFELDRNTERWLLKKLDDLRDSLIYGNGQVCSSTGTLSHVLAFAERTVTSDQFATLSALATKLEAAVGCTSQADLHPKVLKAPTVTTTPTTVAPAPTPKKDTTAKTTQSESRSTEGRKPR
jgi:PKD repeat protein